MKCSTSTTIIIEASFYQKLRSEGNGFTAPYKGKSEPWKTAGEKCIDFANKNLFEPLGLPGRIIHGDSSKEDQFDFFMNKNPRKYEWYSDPQGTVTAGR